MAEINSAKSDAWCGWLSGAPELADFFRSLKGMFGPYRPELHYMRGPGPKWHARHGAST